MSQSQGNMRHHTYRDYVCWADDERWELIGGVAYDMTPAPSTQHQAVVGNLFGIIYNLLRDKPCRVFTSPIDVLLPTGNESDEDVDTTVQPDILVICNPKSIRDKNIRGAPDWVIEVVSPSTAKKDAGIKRDCYQRAGVKEYWLVHPFDQTVMRYWLQDGAYGLPEVFGGDDKIGLTLPDGARIDLTEVFKTE